MFDQAMGQPEISETEPGGITTVALLDKLAYFGVGSQDLKNAVSRGFLPGPVDGLWSPFAVARAKRLYRLHHQGARGKMLKILLFIADGWGWDDIREVCADGVSSIGKLTLNGAQRYARAKGDLSFSVEDIAEHQHRALIRKVGDRPDLRPTSVETMAFSVGMLRDGVPLDGGTSRRLIEPLLRAWIRGLPNQIVDYAVLAFDMLAGFMDLRLARLVERVENATPAQVEHARLKLRENVFFIRRLVKKMGGKDSVGHSLNILTFFGHAKEMKETDFSQGDVKLSPTKIMGGYVGMTVALNVAFSEFLDKLPTWLSALINSM